MRSPRLFAGALMVLLGVPLAILAAQLVEDGAGIVIHLALGAGFLLIASAALDFELPVWLGAPAALAVGALGFIFLLQGVSDLLHAEALRQLAYATLGQRFEKILGYAFLIWCLALLWFASAGWRRVVGALVLAFAAAVEFYGLTIAPAPEWTKLLYLPIFMWLMLEGFRPKQRG